MAIRRVIEIFLVLWVMRMSIFLLGKESGASMSWDPYTLAQISITLLTFLTIFFFQQKVNVLPVFYTIPLSFFSILYFYGILSSFWSEIPFYSFFMALQNLSFLLVGYYLMIHKRYVIELESYFIKLCLIFIVFDLIRGWMAIKSPLFIFQWHELKATGISAVLLCYSIAELNSRFIKLNKMRKKRLIKVSIFSFLILVFGTSSGANVSALAGLIAIIMLSDSAILKALSILLILFLFLMPDLFPEIINALFPGKTEEEILSAGSRTHLWDMIILKASEKPFFGWGYAVVERIIDRPNVDPHNSFLGIYGGLGVIGVTIFIVGIFVLMFYTYNKRKKPGYAGLLAGIVCMVVNSNTFGFLSSKTTTLAITFFLLVNLTYLYNYRAFQPNRKQIVIK